MSRRKGWDVADDLMKEFPSVLVAYLADGRYEVCPRGLPPEVVPALVYDRAVYLRRALPGLVRLWDVKRVERSQLPLI